MKRLFALLFVFPAATASAHEGLEPGISALFHYLSAHHIGPALVVLSLVVALVALRPYFRKRS